MARYVELRRHTDNADDTLSPDGVRSALEIGATGRRVCAPEAPASHEAPALPTTLEGAAAASWTAPSPSGSFGPSRCPRRRRPASRA